MSLTATTPEQDARPGIPWENEQSFPAFAETFKAIARDSERLFRSAGQDLPIGSALTYGLILGLVITLGLAGRFLPKFFKDGGWWPAGVEGWLGAAGLILSVLALVKK